MKWLKNGGWAHLRLGRDLGLDLAALTAAHIDANLVESPTRVSKSEHVHDSCQESVSKKRRVHLGVGPGVGDDLEKVGAGRNVVAATCKASSINCFGAEGMR
jgi:hypothetical protein